MAEDPEKPEEKPAEMGLTMAQVMKHPLVQEMTSELKSLRRTLDALPEVIGRAVAEAQKAKRIPGLDISNPELLAGGQPKEDAVVQNLRRELDKTREEVGYKPPTTRPPEPKK